MSKYELAYLKLVFQNMYLHNLGKEPIQITPENIMAVVNASKTTRELFKVMYRMKRLSLSMSI